MGKHYTEYSEFLARLFPGLKVQKIAIDAGHNCPNRDGTLGHGGCIYCNNEAFSPPYCHTAGSVAAQIDEGRRFFARKYPDMRYLAYFQAYTSTHAPHAELLAAYEEAMAQPGVAGLVIGTRPDCMQPALLGYLARVNATRMPVIVEYGVETVHDSTLTLINRHHTSECARQAVRQTKEAGIPVGLHLIMGLPGESRDMMLQSVREVCSWGVDVIKLHQLQVVRDTPLWRLWQAQQTGAPMPPGYAGYPPVTTFGLDTYLGLCRDIVSLVPRSVAIERFTAQCPPALLAAPCWHIKNYQFTHRLQTMLQEDTQTR